MLIIGESIKEETNALSRGQAVGGRSVSSTAINPWHCVVPINYQFTSYILVVGFRKLAILAKSPKSFGTTTMLTLEMSLMKIQCQRNFSSFSAQPNTGPKMMYHFQRKDPDPETQAP